MSASLGFGVYLVYLSRRPVLAHIDDALARDGSFSVVAFAARRCRPDAGAWRLVCVVVLFASAALVLIEALAVRWAFELLFPHALLPASAAVAGLVIIAAIQAVAAGHAAALHAAQLQFGLMYLGLLGSAALLLYAQAATLVPLGRADASMLAIGTLACVALAFKRRSRYVDAEPIRPAGLDEAERPPLASRALRGWAKLTNQSVSTLLVLVIVIGGMALYGVWSQAGARGPAPGGALLPAWAVATLCVVLVLHPMVDLAVWQQLAALRVRAGPAELAREESEHRVRSTFRARALQSAMLGLVVAMLGSLVATAIGMRGSGGTLSAIPSRLAALDADLGGLLLPCAALALTACALATIAAQFSAMLCTLRLDLWGPRGVGLSDVGKPQFEPRCRRGATCVVLALAGIVAALAVLVPFPGSTAGLSALALLCCGQLALLPVIRPWRDRASTDDPAASEGQGR